MFGGYGARGPGGAGGFMAGSNGYAGQEDMMYDDEDDFDQHDSINTDEYDQEDITDESEILREQQRHLMAQKANQMKYEGPGSKPIGSSLTFGAQKQAPPTFIGGGAQPFGGGTQFGGTQFGAMSGGVGMGGGGFTYGMASGAGSIFGAPSGSQAQPSFGGTNFGQIGGGQNRTGAGLGGGLTFGGLGGAGGFTSGSGGLGGTDFGGGSDDPYANIQIDLNAVTAATKTANETKPFEKKTEEEKRDDAAKRQSSIKSNLKTTKEDFDKASKNKKEVRFGKQTTYQVSRELDDSDDFNKDDIERKGSPRPTKKVIEEKDLSDGRDEKEKIEEQMRIEEEERRRELLEMKEAMKKKEKDTPTSTTVIEKMRIDQARVRESLNIDESAASSSISVTKKPIEESYSSDAFDESMSGSKQSNIWTEKAKQISEQAKKYSGIEESANSNLSGLKTVSKNSSSPIEESSERYEDDEFDSISKSKGEMPWLGKPQSKPQSNLPTLKDKQAQQQPESVISKYVRKENKQTMTVEGKFDSNTGQGETIREWSLKKNLEEAEMMIQELKSQRAEDREEVRQLELRLQKKDGEYQSARREALGYAEDLKRQKDLVSDQSHKINLYKIEQERLIKEIDMADAKTRAVQEDLIIARAEAEREQDQIKQRILYSRGKQEERSLVDLKRDHSIAIEDLRRRLDEKIEEVDYLNEKVNKLEVQNKELILQRESKDGTKQLETKIALLTNQLAKYESNARAGGSSDVDGIKDNLSPQEQQQIQQTVKQQWRMIDTLNKENEDQGRQIRKLKGEVRDAGKRFQEERKRLQEFQMQAMLENKTVFLEENSDLNMQTVNVMGAKAITQDSLKDLQSRVKLLQEENDKLTRGWKAKEETLKSINDKVTAEKVSFEKRLLESEFLVGEKLREIDRIRQENMNERAMADEQIKELEDKISWFRENQKVISEQQGKITTQGRELQRLQARMQEADEERAKNKEFEKKIKLLETTLKARNPNSIPMLIQATQDAKKQEEDDVSKKQLKFRIQSLEAQLESQDKDFEVKLRALRQEMERQRSKYENRAANPAEAKKVNELEDELIKQKQYFTKRIKEIEEQYRYGGSKQNSVAPTNAKTELKSADHQTSQAEVEKMRRIIEEYQVVKDQLLKDKKLLAQKVIELQSTIEQQRHNSKAAPSTMKESLTESNDQLNLDLGNLSGQDQRNAMLNPFFIQESRQTSAQPTPQKNKEILSGPKSIPQLFTSLRQLNLREFAGKHLKVSQLYTCLQGILTIEEVKQIRDFLSTKNSSSNPNQREDNMAVSHDAQDYIDMDDLIEAVKLQDTLHQRSIGDVIQHSLGEAHQSELDSLNHKVKRILREKDDDAEFFSSKIRQLKRQLKDVTLEKGELQEVVSRLEGQKARLEKFYKEKLGLEVGITDAHINRGQNTLSQTLQSQKTGELMVDVSMFQRRIEYLEEQAQMREKLVRSEHEPCRREIERLTEDLQSERACRASAISKKNAEIAYFKNELDALLNEIQNTSASSGTKSNKTNSPNFYEMRE